MGSGFEWFQANEYIKFFSTPEGNIALLSLLLGLASFFWKLGWRWIKSLVTAATNWLDAVGFRNRIDKRFREIRRDGRWARKPLPKDCRLQYLATKPDRLPVVFIANNKGGVGKTTLAANLGAHFALKQNKKVLFIDLDFQANLSEPLRRIAEVPPGTPGRLSSIFRVDALPGERLDTPWSFWSFWDLRHLFRARLRAPSARDLLHFSHQMVGGWGPDLPGNYDGSRFLDTDEKFADLEDYLFARWVMGKTKNDIRFILSRLLQTSAFRDAFDIVIIDGPPRMTTGAINGLCAATHILAPTRAEDLSIDGCLTYMRALTDLRRTIAPHARMLGFVRTFGNQADPNIDQNKDRLESLIQENPVRPYRFGPNFTIPGLWPKESNFSFIGDIPERENFRRDARNKIAYENHSELREYIDPIGDKISKAIWPNE